MPLPTRTILHQGTCWPLLPSALLRPAVLSNQALQRHTPGSRCISPRCDSACRSPWSTSAWASWASSLAFSWVSRCHLDPLHVFSVIPSQQMTQENVPRPPPSACASHAAILSLAALSRHCTILSWLQFVPWFSLSFGLSWEGTSGFCPTSLQRRYVRCPEQMRGMCCDACLQCSYCGHGLSLALEPKEEADFTLNKRPYEGKLPERWLA